MVIAASALKTLAFSQAIQTAYPCVNSDELFTRMMTGIERDEELPILMHQSLNSNGIEGEEERMDYMQKAFDYEGQSRDLGLSFDLSALTGVVSNRMPEAILELASETIEAGRQLAVDYGVESPESYDLGMSN